MQDRDQSIRAAYPAKSMPELAREHGISVQRVYQVIHPAGQGMKPGGQFLEPHQRKEYRKLKNALGIGAAREALGV